MKSAITPVSSRLKIVAIPIGLAFDVTLGIGTVITALFMGPLTQWFRVNLAEPLLTGGLRPAN